MIKFILRHYNLILAAIIMEVIAVVWHPPIAPMFVIAFLVGMVAGRLDSKEE